MNIIHVIGRVLKYDCIVFFKSYIDRFPFKTILSKIDSFLIIIMTDRVIIIITVAVTVNARGLHAFYCFW